MARALELARRADFRTSPNPMVGAVVLDAAGRLAGEGFHERAGQPHAEAVALAAAGPAARGGTVYVTLEPCSHTGRTPPCADALVAAGVRRVVIGVEDPDQRVRGRGIARLREAGIEVEVGEHAAEASRLVEMFAVHRTLGRPFVTIRWAMTLDGRIATATGDARWVSNEASRRHSHRQRHEHDAILVGVGTVLADDPELTARHQPGARQPLRVVLDSELRTPVTAKVAGPNTVIYSKRSGSVGGAEVVRLDEVTVAAVLADLARRDVLSVLVEGGARVHGSFVDSRLFDRVVVYVAPKLVGSASAPGPVAGAGFDRMADALGLRVESVEPLDGDLAITARPY